MPNFRAIGQSVWEKNGNRQKHRQKHRNTETQKDRLEFYKDRCTRNKHWLILRDSYVQLWTNANCKLQP